MRKLEEIAVRRSIPSRVPLELGPAIWYNANGHEWGYIGSKGELLDQEGNPLPESPPSKLLGCLVGLIVIVLILGAILFGMSTPPNDHPGPNRVIPSPTSQPRASA